MKRDYDELLQAGNKAQLEKLIENEHKDGFDDIDIEYALDRLLDEYIELRKEIKSLNDSTSKIWHRRIRHEAADVANFAHMIILRCDKELQG